ncbi:MAG: TonB-dependent receptor [Gammaproteobacteria bacterium]|nr:TonB-dependent receptor [Gammaproteobacteria bacterium]
MAQSRSGLPLVAALALACSPLPLLLPAAGWAQVEEIVVSARRKEESLQDVPIAINAISGEELERKGLSSISDITKGLSSVEFDEGASKSDTRITIRGLSPTRGRQNVAVLVDGIDVSTEAISNSGGGVLLNTRLVDIERIDVLKGPQMALYGRSAFAGAIQYVTKDPSEVFESTFSADANVEDQYSATMGLSGPVFGDKLGLRFNAAWWDEQGFYDNTITGNSLADDEGFGLALTAKSQVTDNVTLKFRAEYQDQQTGPSATAFLKFNDETLLPESSRTPFTDPVSGITYPAEFRCFEALASRTYNAALAARNSRLYAPGYTPTGPTSSFPNVLYSSPYCETAVASFVGGAKSFNENDIAVSPNPFTDQDYEGIDRQLIRLSLVADWDIGWATLSSHTGYIHEDAFEAADNGKFAFKAETFSPLTGPEYSNGAVNAFLLTTDKLTTQLSQELMLRTNLEGAWQGTLGALYWKENVGNVSNSLTVQGSGSHCAWSSGSGQDFGDLGLVDPQTACYGYTERAVAPLMRGGFNFTDGSPYNGIDQYKDPSPADRNTEHKSVFGMLEYEATDDVKLTFEGRYNRETVEAVGPQFLDPLASGGPGSWNPCGFFFRPCTDDFMFGAATINPATGFPWDMEHPYGGPFYSQQAFESWYDAWSPNQIIDSLSDTRALNALGITPTGPTQDCTPAPVPEDPERLDCVPLTSFTPSGFDKTWDQLTGNNRYYLARDVIPAQCLRDPKIQARLASVDAGNPDQFDLFNPYCVDSIKRTDSWFAPKLTVSWKVNDDLNTYFSWAQSEKPGGFSTLGIGSSGLNRELLEFEPEKLMVWEIGAKKTALDGTLVVNTAAFFQDFSEKQTLVSVLNKSGDRLVNRLENVNGAEVLGVEMDVAWQPESMFLGGNWALTGSYTYLDAQYVDAVVTNSSFTFIAGAGNCTPVVTRPPVNEDSNPYNDIAPAVLCDVSLDGKKLEDAPKGKFVGSIGYKTPVAEDTDFFIESEFLWVDRRYIEATNESWVEPDTNVDLRLGLRNDRWEVTGYVLNVFDDDTIANVLGGPSLSCCFILGSGIDLAGNQPPSDDYESEPGKTVTVELPQFRAAFAPDPRVIGIRARYKFGGE